MAALLPPWRRYRNYGNQYVYASDAQRRQNQIEKVWEETCINASRSRTEDCSRLFCGRVGWPAYRISLKLAELAQKPFKRKEKAQTDSVVS